MNLFARRLPKWALIAIDVVVAVLALLASVGALRGDGWEPERIAVAVAFVPPIALRRVWPVAAFGMALVANGLVLIRPVGPMLMFLTTAMTIYTVALVHPWRRSVIALAAGLIVTLIATLISLRHVPRLPHTDWPDPYFMTGTAWLAVVAGWTLGVAMRTRREVVAQDAAEHAGRAVAEERLRIARELHDVLAHAMSLITVKAGVAAKVLDRNPDEGREALRTIEATGRSSLAEMRQMLGVLRAHPGLTPAPGLEDLSALARQTEQAGVSVDLSVTGEVPDGMALSVYRIVQEALTNVVRHAAPARCRVEVRAADGRVSIEVADDGPGTRVPPGESRGQGLIGMRERVMMYGGEFTAGSAPQGGFKVEASWETP